MYKPNVFIQAAIEGLDYCNSNDESDIGYLVGKYYSPFFISPSFKRFLIDGKEINTIDNLRRSVPAGDITSNMFLPYDNCLFCIQAQEDMMLFVACFAGRQDVKFSFVPLTLRLARENGAVTKEVLGYIPFGLFGVVTYENTIATMLHKDIESSSEQRKALIDREARSFNDSHANISHWAIVNSLMAFNYFGVVAKDNEPSKKLNKKRAKRGDTPFISYSTLRLPKSHSDGYGLRVLKNGEMPWHEVRAHGRNLRHERYKKKFTTVKAHARGDVKNGIRFKDYLFEFPPQ